jgi:hypothetical protein
MFKSRWLIGLLLPVFVIQAYAGDDTGKKDLKDIYTAITNKVNSAMLTRSGSNEIFGSASFQSLKTEYEAVGQTYVHIGNQSTQQLLNVDLGYVRFIFNNLSLGILFSMRYQRETTNSLGYEHSHSDEQTWVGPVVKKYFGNDRIRPFVTAGYLLLRGDVNASGEANMGVGLLVHASGNMGIALQAQYGVLNTKNTDSIKYISQNRLLFGVGLTHFIL